MLKIRKMRADHVVDFAAEELKKYLRMMMPECGEIEIAYQPGAAEGFRLGLLEDFGLDLSEVDDPVLDDILHIDTDAAGGVIAGSNPRSVLMAVYRYLRENGCRWLYPGVDGEYIPVADIHPVQYHKMADHRFRGVCNEGAESQQCMLETIDFNPKVGMNVYMMEHDIPLCYYDRYYSHEENQQNRPPEPVTPENVKQWKRMCEAELSKRGLQFHDMGHGWTAEPFGLDTTTGWKESNQTVPKETEECLAMIDGKRQLFGGIPLNTNVCMSNPKVRAKMAAAIADYAETHQNVDYLHVWLADNSHNHCACAECKKRRPADHYIQIMNEADTLLTERGLDTRIVFIAYVDTLWAPEKERIRNPKRFSLLFAPITRDYTESADIKKVEEAPPFVYNGWEPPKTAEGNMALLREWEKVWPGPVFAYEYHFWQYQYYDPGAMEISRRIYEDVRVFKSFGIDGCVEDGSQRSFFPNGLSMYTYAEALFDSEITYEQILEDYMSHAYGADWRAVADYLSRVSALMDFAYLCGLRSADPARGKYYCPAQAERLKQLPALLEEGRALVETHFSMPVRVQTVSYRLLWRHLEYCAGIAEFMTEKALGNDEKAYALEKAFADAFGRHECEIERYFDHGLALHFLGRIVRLKQKKSAIMGE